MTRSVFFYLFLVTPLTLPHGAFIIVPGTWSASSHWHLPGGTFFEALNAAAARLKMPVITFVWSGKNSHRARVEAAQDLAQKISEFDEVHLVAHSHGSNVGILASHLLIRPHKIKNFFALGTPVSPQHYFPNMSCIKHFFNFFSMGDSVQTVFGLFQRTFPPHERMANIRVMIDGLPPSHSGLHHPSVANFLPFLATGLPAQRIPELFVQPGLMHFWSEGAPHYETDTHQQDIIDLEQIMLTIATMDRKLKHA